MFLFSAVSRKNRSYCGQINCAQRIRDGLEPQLDLSGIAISQSVYLHPYRLVIKHVVTTP